MGLRMVLDPRDAEEAMMDAFLHVWRKAFLRVTDGLNSRPFLLS
jgi:hypothetical protein